MLYFDWREAILPVCVIANVTQGKNFRATMNLSHCRSMDTSCYTQQTNFNINTILRSTVFKSDKLSQPLIELEQVIYSIGLLKSKY